MACKILAGTPVAFAARQLPGQHSASPWRTMLVGDPLFTLIGEQTPRIQIEAIEGAQPVMQPEDTAPLTARLRDTVLVQRQAARELALTCLEKPDPLEADDLARAVWVLYGHGTFDTLSALSDELLKGHRMARILVHLSRLTSTQYDPQKEIINRTRINDPSRGENSSD
jgi:hypothetical protein